MKDEAYLQFPLPLVGFGDGKKEILNRCIDYGICRFAEHIADDDPDMHELPEKLPMDCRQSNQDLTLVRAGESLGVIVGSVKNTRSRAKESKEFLDALNFNSGNPPLVRIKRELIFDIRDNPQWKLIDFQVLCAVYSSIGSKPYSRINWERVAMLSTGAKNQDTLNYLKRPLPTRKQVRRALDKLQALGFFSRVVLNKRITFVSNRLKEADLIREAQKTTTPSKGATFIGKQQKGAT